MKIPEKAPKIEDVLKRKETTLSVIRLSISEGFRETIKRANKEYLYWDRFKYLDFADGIIPEVAWTALKIARIGQAKSIPLADPTGLLFNYWLPDAALQNIHFIDQNASGQILVDEQSIFKGERERYLVSSIIEEAIASSQIEGAATTRPVAKDMLRTGRKPVNRAEQMIHNNYVTIMKIKDLIDRPLTPGLLTELQASMTKDTLDDPSYAGRFRTEEDGPIEVSDIEGQVLHTLPNAAEIPQSIKRLCEFANEERETEFVHPLVKGILLHFWLAYLHPFMDGNGRTARALFYWYMLKKKYWLIEYLSISRIILKARNQYYRAFLYSELDGGDVTYFMVFHLRAIRLAIHELKLYLERKQKEARDAERLLRKFPEINHRQRAVLIHALTHPEATYTFRSHTRSHRVVYQTGRTDLLDLAEKGFLEKVKKKNAFYFVPAKDLEKKLK